MTDPVGVLVRKVLDGEVLHLVNLFQDVLHRIQVALTVPNDPPSDPLHGQVRRHVPSYVLPSSVSAHRFLACSRCLSMNSTMQLYMSVGDAEWCGRNSIRRNSAGRQEQISFSRNCIPCVYRYF